jgi:alpha-D-xyloside xylohydrolase
LETGKDSVLETENYTSGALQVLLNWRTPEIFAIEKTTEKKEQIRNAYLPAGHKCFDIWTCKTYEGEQTIIAPAPIEIMPLYLKAGSIIQMGQFIQYATKQPADPIELRIYASANGVFTLYEYENDNYNYERNIFSTIGFSWNDTKHQLTIGKHQGSFP